MVSNVAVVSDNDGSAFITKAEFDSLKNNFQAQIDNYNQSIDSKIDGAIAAYLAGIKIESGGNHLEVEWAADFPDFSTLYGGKYIDMWYTPLLAAGVSSNNCVFAPRADRRNGRINDLKYMWVGYFSNQTSSSYVCSGGEASSMSTAPSRLFMWNTPTTSSLVIPIRLYIYSSPSSTYYWAKIAQDKNQWSSLGYTLSVGTIMSDITCFNRGDSWCQEQIVDEKWSNIAGWDVTIQAGGGYSSLSDANITSYIPVIRAVDGRGRLNLKYYLAQNPDSATYKAYDWCNGVLTGVGLKDSVNKFSFILKHGSSFTPITPEDGNIFRSEQQTWIGNDVDLVGGDQLLFAFKTSTTSNNVFGTIRLAMDYTNYDP